MGQPRPSAVRAAPPWRPAGRAGHGGSRLLVPFVAAIVPDVDLAAGRLVIDPPPGLLDRLARPTRQTPVRRHPRARHQPGGHVRTPVRQ